MRGIRCIYTISTSRKNCKEVQKISNCRFQSTLSTPQQSDSGNLRSFLTNLILPSKSGSPNNPTTFIITATSTNPSLEIATKDCISAIEARWGLENQLIRDDFLLFVHGKSYQ
jgi:hypothetical protein